MDKIMSIKGTKSIFSNEIIFAGSCTLASVGVGEVMEAQRFANTSSFHQHLTSLYTLCFQITAIVTPAVHELETF